MEVERWGGGKVGRWGGGKVERWGGGESGGWREWESVNIDLNERVGGGACVGGRRGRMREGRRSVVSHLCMRFCEHPFEYCLDLL